MNIKLISPGGAASNCYLIINEETKKALVVDPGAGGRSIYNYIQEQGLTLAAVLLTHGHYDHIGGAAELAGLAGVMIYAGKPEKELLESASMNVSDLFGNPMTLEADCFLEDGQQIELGGLSFKVIMTPGHTKGGCCFYFAEEKQLFSGDTLFHGSVGRSDFPTGDTNELIRSIKQKLFVLPDDVMVWPGHQDKTTIGYEKQSNPFVQ